MSLPYSGSSVKETLTVSPNPSSNNAPIPYWPHSVYFKEIIRKDKRNVIGLFICTILFLIYKKKIV